MTVENSAVIHSEEVDEQSLRKFILFLRNDVKGKKEGTRVAYSLSESF